MTKQQRIQKIKDYIKAYGEDMAALALIKRLFDKDTTKEQESVYINYLTKLGYINLVQEELI